MDTAYWGDGQRLAIVRGGIESQFDKAAYIGTGSVVRLQADPCVIPECDRVRGVVVVCKGCGILRFTDDMYLSVQMYPAIVLVVDVVDAERRLGIDRERTRYPPVVRSVVDTLAYLQCVGYDQGERAKVPDEIVIDLDPVLPLDPKGQFRAS